MKIEFTESFQKKAKKLIRRDLGLNQIFKKQFGLFNTDPRHPALHMHKLSGQRSEQYAIKIKEDLRALCVIKKDVAIFFDLITHDEY